MTNYIYDQALLYYNLNLADKITFRDFCDKAYDNSRPPGDKRLFFGEKGTKERRQAQFRRKDLNPNRFEESFDFEVSCCVDIWLFCCVTFTRLIVV